ncbi:MAG TPA: S-adenosylmethionine decarboxylase, partial [Hyphomicrobiaceae bacterium]|nr:S-adenosylmethionine decarboxylase [Hyphomicrobiaceae bacterium]
GHICLLVGEGLMAYQDALFQLGMDLTRSSTAQKEDHGESAPAAHVERKDRLVEHDDQRFAGTHLSIDLIGAEHTGELPVIEAALKRCVEAAGAKLLHIYLHHVGPSCGVSGIVVLAEGQISLLSRPALRYAALDVFVGGKVKPHLAIEVLKEAFRPTSIAVKEHLRTNALAEHKPVKLCRRAPVRERAQAAA